MEAFVKRYSSSSNSHNPPEEALHVHEQSAVDKSKQRKLFNSQFMTCPEGSKIWDVISVSWGHHSSCLWHRLGLVLQILHNYYDKHEPCIYIYLLFQSQICYRNVVIIWAFCSFVTLKCLGFYFFARNTKRIYNKTQQESIRLPLFSVTYLAVLLLRTKKQEFNDLKITHNIKIWVCAHRDSEN